MNIISDLIFKYSKSKNPNKKEKFKGVITANALNVRVWAGTEHKPCSFSPLHGGDLIIVCDAIRSNNGKLWYYILYNGKYGFASSTYIDIISDKHFEFLEGLKEINTIVKKHPTQFKYGYDPYLNTIAELKNRISKNYKISITCAVPIKLALNRVGLKKTNGSSVLMAMNGSFKSYFNGSFTKYLNRLIKDEAIGKTTKEAVDKGLLKAGDTICFENFTHIFTYTGNKYLVYDGGHGAIKGGKYTGILVDYKTNKRKISEIIRWKK